MREAAGASADLFAFNVLRQVTVSFDGRPPVVAGGLLASGGYFETLGVEMSLGRALGEFDDRPGAPLVTVVSHGFWMRELGADPHVIGRMIRLNDALFEIVGVTARGYRGLSQGGFVPATDLTVTLAQQPVLAPQWSAIPAAGASLFTSDLAWVRVMARSPAPSPAVERALGDALRREYARLPGAEGLDLTPVGVRMLPGARGLDAIRTDVARPLSLLAGVAGIVLVMACLNLAGLLLARGVARERELAVRRALGGGRLRIVRGLLAECVLLAGLGGAVGLILAAWAAPLAESMLATGLGAGVTLGIDVPMLVIAAAVAALAALLAGVTPALRLSSGRASLLGQRGGGTSRRAATGRGLIALQIAVSVPLLVGMGLLLRTIHNLDHADLGFSPDGIVVFRVDPRLAGGTAERDPLPLYDRILERVRSVPGVSRAALVEHVLASGRRSNSDVFRDGEKIDINMNAVGPDFFETMGVPIVAGRAIGPGDRGGAPVVAVINETAAARYFPGRSPLGRRFTVGRQEVEIVGVAGDARDRHVRTPPQPMFYDSYAQRSLDNVPGLAVFLTSGTPSPIHIVLRSSVPPARMIEAIPAAVREVAPELPVTDLETQRAQIDETIARERMVTRLLVVLGGFAVLLACIGLYGVTAYSVARRTNEIGVRVALGAQRAQVVWLVLRHVLVVALAGVMLGVPLAVAAGPVVGSLLFGLAPRDPLTIASAAASMLAVALLAGWLPARRAARLPAVVALRQE
jgi:predicted permease